MKVHITIAEDAGAAPAPAAGAERQLDVTRAADITAAVDAGPAAPGTDSARPEGSVTDGGEAPAWLAELVRLADAGEVARPGEEPQETRRPSDGLSMDAGSAGGAPR
ncbi:hypothetical protein [Streptomyces sp. BA2]|uniref:hypothetical protein n=1 Tax=Streptomyces sp. BA2 TaxID=436595 RepID=UPI00132B07D2|nr:hypothetical protein [Streptomyces sp. BA2]MWA09600.1 hypothetical protein [Streptomyces sp. BA2]